VNKYNLIILIGFSLLPSRPRMLPLWPITKEYLFTLLMVWENKLIKQQKQKIAIITFLFILMIYDEAFLRGWLSRQIKNIAKEVIKICTNWGIENPSIEKRPDLRSTENWGPRRLVKNHNTNAIIVFQNFWKLFFGRRLNVFFLFPVIALFFDSLLMGCKVKFHCVTFMYSTT